MPPLADLQIPDSVEIPLKTLTPLYTGGIGQHGEQLHPSGLLGSIRHFSCLVARALDERDFEHRVWGDVGQENTYAKRVAIHWDGSGLSLNTQLDSSKPIRINNNRGWYFNKALTGDCRLQLSQRGICASDWQILLLALRIQIRHATFGAKDQFGFGVLTAEQLPKVDQLPKIDIKRPKEPKETETLWNSVFFNVKFRSLEKRSSINLHDALEMGLAVRYALRNSLRGNPDTEADKQLRHLMMGALNDHGSNTNVSAVYISPIGSCFEFRIMAQLKMLTQSEEDARKQRNQVTKAFFQTLKNFKYDSYGWDFEQCSLEWAANIGSEDKHKFKTISEWINYLAGV